MQKIKSLIIALLCTVAQGAWATDYTVSNETELRGAIENNANITLTQDITIGSAITFNDGITVTIDLGGHTLNRNSTSDSRSQVIGVFSGSTLNISNGTLTGGWGGDGGILNQATLNMTNVTMRSAEIRLGIRQDVARFVLPLCTTINMNGCAAFILVTSLFVMQNGGMFTLQPFNFSILPFLLLWIFISVVTAVGNAGVPMGCFFLTLSLMTGIGAPIAVMGIILPIYTIIDMVETAENVWSDSCVSALVDRDLQ